MSTSPDPSNTHQPTMPTNLSPTAISELRHITSNPNLVSPTRERRLSNRNSQHLRTHRLGSRSPASIPSSPTSVHSSSSAIFERDIEPITPSTFTTPSDPHRIPRGKYTEQLEQSVPSVLDSAAAILTSADAQDDDFDAVSIVTPAPLDSGYRSGFTSPNSRLSSRSPSPTGMGKRTSLLFSASPTHATIPLQQQGSPPFRPTIQTQAPLPAVPAIPSSAYYSATSAAAPDAGSEVSSPTTATHHEHPLHTLPSPPPGQAQAKIMIPSTMMSHPPSPKAASKRLSFISYMDLLSSTPASTLPLSTLTTSAFEPPPHLPSVIGLPQAQYAASSGASAGSVHAAGSLLERDAAGPFDDMGGEWEREGLGKGLEERLEALNNMPPPLSGKA